MRVVLFWVYTFIYFFFFFNDTATTEIYTLSLHDALPISRDAARAGRAGPRRALGALGRAAARAHRTARRSLDRKSTRLNSSHSQISYAVFCLQKKIHIQMHAGPHALSILRSIPTSHLCIP